MLADVLAQRVRLVGSQSSTALLTLHVGDHPPSFPGSSPVLHLPSPAAAADTYIRFTEKPWSVCSPVRVPGLGFAPPASGVPVIESDRGPILSRAGNVWTLNADLTGVFGREVVRHSTADTDMQAMLAAQLSIRAVVDCMGLLPTKTRALSLITVDAEDQQRYFLNREGVCSNIRGQPTDDMQFARACRTIMDRCEALDLKAIFMVTGDELDPSFTDAFGDALVGLDDNKRVLQEIGARGHDVACHGFDHEKWLSKGRSAIAPMSTWQKLRYFFETSGDLRTLFGLARFLAQHRAALRRARRAKRERERGDVEPFTYAEIKRDLEAWMELVGFDAPRLLIRYPGYVRAADTLACLDDRFLGAVDSSDLYEIETALPAFPYRLIAERHGQLRRTNVTEIPCVWIDKLLRTRDQRKLDGELRAARHARDVSGKRHELRDAHEGAWRRVGTLATSIYIPPWIVQTMALPIVEESWNRFGRFLRERTQSANWRDLQHALFGVGA